MTDTSPKPAALSTPGLRLDSGRRAARWRNAAGWRKWGSALKPYLYVLPITLLLSVFTIFPILRTVFLSFTDTDAVISYLNFAGVRHYLEMVSSSVFWTIVFNTVLYSVVTVSVSVVIGFLCAVAANSKRTRLGGLFKVSMFYPYILPWTVAAMVWIYLYNPTRGVINHLLNTRIDWLNSYQFALWALMLVYIWKVAGFNFLLFLSGLQTIPEELYEAASLETRSHFQVLRYITVPLISPTTFVTILLAVVQSFQSVDLVYIMTSGRPGNATNVMIYSIYQEGIINWNVGYASALSTVLFLMLLVFTLLYLKMGERGVSYER